MARRGKTRIASPTPIETPTPGVLKSVLVVLALAALTAAVYAPVAHYGFVNFDDPQYVSRNPEVLRGLTWSGLGWALTAAHAGNWHPVTWLSHMLDIQLFGLDAGAHHLTSVGLHIINASLLFFLLRRMTGAFWRSAIVAALFAVHPLHVESVAWIAERKDVLSTGFLMLTLLAYVGYARDRRLARYLLVCVLFALGLMAKPMLVTLPFVLLLMDVWPLARVHRPGLSGPAPGALILEKLPLFALSAASSVVTFVVQQQAGAVKALDALPLGRRVATALVGYAEYIVKTAWPTRLAAIYPYPVSLPAWEVIAALAGLVLITALTVRVRSSHPYVLVGWLWFLGMLVPVIGLAQVGSQPIADRYTYVPAVGLFIIVVWGLTGLVGRWRRAGPALAAVAVLAVAGCAVAARTQVGYWQDSITLWQHAILVTDDNYRAHSNLGDALSTEGRPREAISEYRQAIEIKPDYAEARNYLGLALEDTGDLDGAIAQYGEALRALPSFVDAHNNLGLAYMAKEQLDAAVAQFSEAVRLNPGFGPAHANLGIAFARQGRQDEAVREFSAALAIAPGLVEGHLNMAIALSELGRFGEALGQFDEAVRLDPNLADGHRGRGRVLEQMGRVDDAILAFQEAVRLDPRDPGGLYDLAVLLAGKGRTAEAIQALRLVLQLDPSHDAARRTLAQLTGRR